MAEPVFKDLHGLMKSLRADLFARWMRRAQKQALMEWRDRTAPPGLMARFERAGIGFYDFSQRVRRRPAGFYLKSGGLREMMRRRKPRSLNNRGTDVVTVFKYGGGALNFMTDQRGIKTVSKSTARVPVTMPAVTRNPATVAQFDRPGGIMVKSYVRSGGPVKSYVQTRTTIIRTVNKSDRTMSQEFGGFVRDRAWITKRTGVLFASISRRAAVNHRTGGIKSDVLQGVDNVR